MRVFGLELKVLVRVCRDIIATSMPAIDSMASEKKTLRQPLPTPTLAEQRFILVVFLAIVCIAVWWQRGANNSNYAGRRFSTTPLSDIVERLDFASAEAAWSGLSVDADGNLKIDALTETALADAVALIRNQTSAEASDLAMARVLFLLEKQYGANASGQISALLPVLKIYKELEQQWWQENGAKSPPPYEELFHAQDRLLGAKLAKTMFAKQRRLATMMHDSQKIRIDPKLTQAEKERALLDLQKNFQAEEASVE